MVTLYVKEPSDGDAHWLCHEMKIGYWSIEGLETSGKLKTVTWQMKTTSTNEV